MTLLSWAANAQDIGGQYYVATDGSDSNAGTYAAPFLTWQKAINSAQAGDTVYIRGGEYYTSAVTEVDPDDNHGNSGSHGNPTCYFGYPGEWPILDCIWHCDSIDNPYGDIYNGAISIKYAEHLYFKDFEIRNVHQCDSVLSGAITAVNSRYITFEHIIIHDVGQRGYWMDSGAWKTFYDEGFTTQEPYWDTEDDTTMWINCDTYNLADTLSHSPGNGADGWKVVGYKGNYFEWQGCRAWNYSDDGMDPNTINGAIRVINNCWFMGGGEYAWVLGNESEQNGFKLTGLNYGDPVPYSTGIITNCIAAFCKNGFTFIEYDELERGNMIMYNNTAYHNKTGYYVSGRSDESKPQTAIFRNNLEYASTSVSAGGGWYGVSMGVDPGYCYPESHNTWDCDDSGYPYAVVTDTVTVTNADFVNIDSVTIVQQLTAPRKADGSLPDLTVFNLAATSDLIDAGVDVGLPYAGDAPDIGAFEYGIDEADTIPPTAPSGLTAIAQSDAEIDLTWAASTDAVGVSYYLIHRDDIKVDSTATINYSDIGLSPDIEYEYYVTARDAAFNISDPSNVVQETTEDAPPTPGVISLTTEQMLIDSLTSGDRTGTTFLIELDAISGTYTFGVIGAEITNGNGYSPAFSGKVTVTGNTLDINSMAFNGNLELQGSDLTIDSCTFTTANPLMTISQADSPIITGNTFTTSGAIYSISFPFTDWRGEEGFTIEDNTYNISTGTRFNGLTFTEWKMHYNWFDQNSTFNR